MLIHPILHMETGKQLIQSATVTSLRESQRFKTDITFCAAIN